MSSLRSRVEALAAAVAARGAGCASCRGLGPESPALLILPSPAHARACGACGAFLDPEGQPCGMTGEGGPLPPAIVLGIDPEAVRLGVLPAAEREALVREEAAEREALAREREALAAEARAPRRRAPRAADPEAAPRAAKPDPDRASPTTGWLFSERDWIPLGSDPLDLTLFGD